MKEAFLCAPWASLISLHRRYFPPKIKRSENIYKMIELNNLIINNPQETAVQNFNKLSNDKKVYIETFGCQMNFSDTEIVLSVLSKSGYNETSDINDSDVIL
jgi:hypothetical protein